MAKNQRHSQGQPPASKSGPLSQRSHNYYHPPDNVSVNCYPTERSISTMRRVKTYLHATMKTERLAALALVHAYRDIPIDVEDV